MAAALAGVLLASPVRAENDYDHAKNLIELRWYDMAERLIKKTQERDKAEGALGQACLANGRADSTADLLQKRKLYKEALARIADFRASAAKEHQLQQECLALDAAIQQSLARTGNAIYRDRRNLKISEDELKEIQAEIRKATEEAGKNLLGGVTAAENAYAAALKDYRDSSKTGDRWEEAKRKAFNAYGEAAQNYVRVLLNNADKLDPGSKEQKEEGDKTVRFVNEWMKKQSEKYLEPISEMDDRPVAEFAGMWIYMKFALGRGMALTGSVDNGGKELEKVINGIDIGDFGEGMPRQFAAHYKTKCIYYRAVAWAEKARGSKAEADWQKALNSSWHEIFAGNPGTDRVLMVKSRVLKGECEFRVGRFRDALDSLNRALEEIDRAEQEYRADQRRGLRPETCQSLRFETLQVLADLVNEMRARGLDVNVSPEVLVQAALVSYRNEKYAETVGCCRDAIARARRPDIASDWSKRLSLEGEPKAWYLMGLAYLRSESWIEAQLACEGALLAFWGQDGTAIPEKIRNGQPQLIEQLKAEILMRCINNGRIAAASERQSSPSKFNTAQVKSWLRWQARLDPSGDIDFSEARLVYDSAVLAAEEHQALKRANKTADALRKKDEAIKLFREAEEAFLKVPDKSPSREEAIFWAAMCCYQSADLLGGQKQTEEDRKSANDLSEKALKLFGQYRTFIKDTPPRPRSSDPGARETEKRDIETRREKRLAAIDMTVPYILIGLKKYEEALTAAEKLRGLTNLDGAQQESLHQVIFKCLIELAKEHKDLQKAVDLLKRAEAEADWFKVLLDKAQGPEADRIRKNYYAMASRLGSAYDGVYKRAREANNEALARSMFEKQGVWYKVLLQDPANQTIDGLGRTAKIFFELGNYAAARELYEKLLKFDTRGDGTKVADDKLMPFDKLKEAVKGVDFPSVEMTILAKGKLDAIKTATLGGTREYKDQDGQVVKIDVPKDYDRALGLINRFLDDYKNYDTVEGKAGDARKGIEALREELEFRLKILRASNEITTCYVALGNQLIEEKKADEAKDAFQKGLANATNALKLWPRDAELIFNKAFCQVSIGDAANLSEAAKTLGDLRRGTRYGGELWWKATRAYAQALILQGQHKDAQGIIVQILLATDEEALKFNWPEVQEVATGLAEKMFPGTTGQAALDKLLGDKVKMPDFNYTPKSEIEKEVDRQIFALRLDLKNGKVSDADLKAREELLREFVQIAKDNPAALRNAKDLPDSLIIKLQNGRLRSLKSLGGVSRGEENDRLSPELKADQETPAPAPPSAPAPAEKAVEPKQPGKAGAEVPVKESALRNRSGSLLGLLGAACGREG